jgi:hypothetical protein
MLVRLAKRQEARDVSDSRYYVLVQSSRASQYTDFRYLEVEGGREAERARGTVSESLSVS